MVKKSIVLIFIFTTSIFSFLAYKPADVVIAGPLMTDQDLFLKDTAVNGLSWGCGADIPVGNQLCVNVAFTTTYQVQKSETMDYIGNNKPDDTDTVKTAPYRRNVMDFTVGVRYDF